MAVSVAAGSLCTSQDNYYSGNRKLAGLLGVSGGVHVVAFYLVEFGHCTIRLVNEEKVLLKAGEIAICFGRQAQRLLQGKASQSQLVEALLKGEINFRRPNAGGQNVGVSLLCGVFLMHNTVFNRLFDALPSFMHANLSRPGGLHNLSGVARLRTEEVDRGS